MIIYNEVAFVVIMICVPSRTMMCNTVRLSAATKLSRAILITTKVSDKESTQCHTA